MTFVVVRTDVFLSVRKTEIETERLKTYLLTLHTDIYLQAFRRTIKIEKKDDIQRDKCTDIQNDTLLF